MLITVLVRRPVRGTFAGAWNIAVRTRGVFTHRAGFQKPACAKRGLVRTGQHLGGRAWCARRVNYSQASSEPTTSPAPEATRQSNQQPRQHHTPTRINHISSTRSHAPIKPAAPATPHINPQQPQQPQHQRQKPHTNRITNAKTARQPRHQSWQNRISSNKSHAPTESPPSATPRANHLTSAAGINASCTATGRRRPFP